MLADLLCPYSTPTDSTYHCSEKPPVVVFDADTPPGSLGASTDIAHVDRLFFDALNRTINVYLVEDIGGEWQDYSIILDYSYGAGEGRAAAAIGRVKESGDTYILDVAYWSDFASNALTLLEESLAKSFVDVVVLEDPYQIYPHFWMREKYGIGLTSPPYLRESYFKSYADGDYGNVLNLVFDRYISVPGGFGYTHSHRNTSFVVFDSFLEYDRDTGTLDFGSLDESTRNAFRHTVVHEITHHFRVGADIDPGPDGGEHCDQETLGYEPFEGPDPLGCYMQSGENYPPDITVMLNLCEYSLLGDRPNGDFPDLGIRRRDGLYVDLPNWDGAPQ